MLYEVITIERLCYRPKFNLVIARQGDRARRLLDRLSVAQTCFQINPQLNPLPEAEAPAYRLRRQPPRPLDPIEQRLLTQAVSFTSGFRGAEMAERLGMTGDAADVLYDLLWRLERDEWLYRVITSYSIHYTKLYEGDVGHPAGGERVARCVSQQAQGRLHLLGICLHLTASYNFV